MQAGRDVLKKIIIILCSLFLLSGYLTKDEAIYQAAQEGNTSYKAKKYDQAAREYMSGLKIDQKNPVLNYNLANSLYQLGKYQEAVAFYAKSPKDARTFKNMGNSFKRLGDGQKDSNKKISFYTQALAAYKQGIRKAPDDLDLKYNYEYVQKLLKQLERNQQKQDKKQQQKNKDQKQNGSSSKDNKNNGKNQRDNANKNRQNSKNMQKKNSAKQNQQNKNGKQNNKSVQNKNGTKTKNKAINNGKPKIDPKKLKEAMGVLKLLEKNEKDDLKNNQHFRANDESNDKYDW